MPEKKKAAPTGNRKAAPKQIHQRTEIFADTDQPSKQAVDFGRCSCGTKINSNVRSLRCGSCSAWARWRSAFRVAAHALRGPQ